MIIVAHIIRSRLAEWLLRRITKNIHDKENKNPRYCLGLLGSGNAAKLEPVFEK